MSRLPDSARVRGEGFPDLASRQASVEIGPGCQAFAGGHRSGHGARHSGPAGVASQDPSKAPLRRTPALKVGGKGFVRLKEDGRSVVFLLDSVDDQEFLIAAKPSVYYITDHYRGWPAVLARLAALRAPEARLRLEVAWRRKAPKDLIKGLDERSRPGRRLKGTAGSEV